MVWMLVGLLGVALGVSLLFNVAGTADSQAEYFRLTDRVSRSVFARIPPWSFLIAGDARQPSDRPTRLQRFNARMVGVLLIVVGVVTIGLEFSR